MNPTSIKILLALSLLFALTLSATWIDGLSHAGELRISGSAAGIRMHWGNGVLVVIGLRHHAPPVFPGINFWRFPHADGYMPLGPGFVTDRQIFDFGIIHWGDGKHGAGYGVTLPMWFPIALFGVVVPRACARRLRRQAGGRCVSDATELSGSHTIS